MLNSKAIDTLRRRIAVYLDNPATRLLGTLQSPSTTSDGEGGVTATWTDAATNVPYAVSYGLQQTYENLISEQFQGQTRCTITFKHDQAVATNQRLYDSTTGRTFHIHGFMDREGRNLNIRAYCTEIQ